LDAFSDKGIDMQINILNTKKYMPYIVIVVLFILLLTRSASLELKNEKLLNEAKSNDIKAQYYISKYNALKSKDSVLEIRYDSLDSIKSTVKIKYNERIKIIDKYSVSDMQRYFDERTKEGSNTR
jgi:hypothetical protein